MHKVHKMHKMHKMDDTKLRDEILNLFQYIQRLRDEIAAVSAQRRNQTAFESMAVQLGAIVDGTEHATNTILEATEAIGQALAALERDPEPGERQALLETIARRNVQIMEACTFQDITGQRVSKIIGSLRFVEERVDAMVDTWGREEIEALSRRVSRSDGQGGAPEAGEALDGPALPGDAISQEEIDALFE